MTCVCAYSGAVAAVSIPYKSLTTSHDKQHPDSCVSILCQGYENSLAECVISNKINKIGYRMVATATCYEASQPPKGQCVLILLYSFLSLPLVAIAVLPVTCPQILTLIHTAYLLIKVRSSTALVYNSICKVFPSTPELLRLPNNPPLSVIKVFPLPVF